MSDAWELRVAAAQDVDQIASIAKLPTGVVTSFVNCKSCCVATTLDGDIMAAALVNVFKRVKDKEKGVSGGLENNGELLKVAAAKSGANYMKPTALGALKLLKGNGCSSVRATVSGSDDSTVQFYASLGLQQDGGSGENVVMRGNLFAMNPDPQKKISEPPKPRKTVQAVDATTAQDGEDAGDVPEGAGEAEAPGEEDQPSEAAAAAE